MILEKDYTVFLEELKSAAPVPGGGGAAAAAGAMGAALASMVANLTTGKKKYAAYEKEIQSILKQSSQLISDLVMLADTDAEAFLPVSKAYSLPYNTKEEKEYKDSYMDQALLKACQAPLDIMRKTMDVISILEELTVKGSVLAVSDVGVGAMMAKAALKGASLNVFINTKMMKNREKASALNQEAMMLIENGDHRSESIFTEVMAKLGQ